MMIYSLEGFCKIIKKFWTLGAAFLRLTMGQNSKNLSRVSKLDFLFTHRILAEK